MSVALLFTAHNRLEFVRASFEAMLANTDWSLVDGLIVLDDASYDGTREWLTAEVADFYGRTGQRTDFRSERFGGPVEATNYALDQYVHGGVLAKIDSDVIVCPGWLERMLETLDACPRLDVLGMEPGFGAPVRPADELRGVVPARFVGGVGLIRTRLFAGGRPRSSQRFFGWTKFQCDHANCGWVTPDLPVFLLDHLPFEPWRSLTAEYVERGWSRSWPTYPESMAPYWAWWAGDRELVA